MERLRFPRVTFTHVPVLRVRILNERGGGGVSSSQKRNTRRQALPLRSTRRNQKPLFCVSEKSFEAVEVPTRTDLHPKCLSFHPSFVSRALFSPLRKAHTTRTHTLSSSSSSWREKKKPKRSLSKRKSTNC